jgi:cytochrome c oxidase cbb3-type subunit 3
MKPNLPPPEDPVRPHVFDGIQEYDKRLPNWWLYTLYVMILYWLGYWGYYEWLRAGPTGQEVVETAMARIEASRLAVATVDDATLWKVSRNPEMVAAGKAHFATNCVACHLPSMRGKSESPAAIGPDLTDTRWIHGGTPTQVHKLITDGVLTKGMPNWGPVLGARKITEISAYILSVHQEGEPILLEANAQASHP